MESGNRIKIADSGLSPARKIVKTMRQLAMELREAKKPLVVDSKPMTAKAMDASPTKGERNWLSRVVFQEKSGRNATLTLSMNPLRVRPGASKSSGMILGLTKAATTRAASPINIINRVRISGTVGRVLIVKRRCGWRSANSTIKAAR